MHDVNREQAMPRRAVTASCSTVTFVWGAVQHIVPPIFSRPHQRVTIEEPQEIKIRTASASERRCGQPHVVCDHDSARSFPLTGAMR
jgi:hypothetical protein